MRQFSFAVASMLSALLIGCGGNVSVPPAASTFTFPGQPAGPSDPPEPEVNALNGQLWTSNLPGGPQRHVVVMDDLSFLGWWMEQPDSGPPVYGVFEGSLTPQAGTDLALTPDMVSMRLPHYGLSIAQFGMTTPQAGESQLAFDQDLNTTTNTEPMRASALARQSLPMDQRSGRYAGELQLSDRREPVSLQWNGDGSLSLSMTNLLPGACGATGQVSALAGAPARLLGFTLTFSGSNCPTVQLLPPNSVGLNGLSVSGAIDASSADAFVLFGSNGLHRLPLLLPATRVPPPALQGAWTGAINGTQIGFHVAVLDNWNVMGWFSDPTRADQAHGLVLGSVRPPAPGDASFGGDPLLAWVPLSFVADPSVLPGFSGPLPVSETMNGQLGGPATLQAVPIAQQALPMAVRSGSYRGNLQLPQLSVPVQLKWSANGDLSLSLTGWPSCTADGQTGALAAGPARWLSVALFFRGVGCPTVSGTNLAGVDVIGAIDATSGDRFVLFGIDNTRRVPLVLPATRTP